MKNVAACCSDPKLSGSCRSFIATRLQRFVPLSVAFTLALTGTPASIAQEGQFNDSIDVRLATLELRVEHFGDPVDDLSPTEVTIVEDGERRDLIALERIDDGTPTAGSAGESATPANADERTVILAFDLTSLSRWELRRATASALANLPTENGPTRWVVALLSHELYLPQSLTTDVAAVRQVLTNLEARAAEHLRMLWVPFPGAQSFFDPLPKIDPSAMRPTFAQPFQVDPTQPDLAREQFDALATSATLRAEESRLAGTARNLIQLAWAHAMLGGPKDILLAYSGGLSGFLTNLPRASEGLTRLGRQDTTWLGVARELAATGARVHATDLAGLNISEGNTAGHGDPRPWLAKQAQPDVSYAAARLVAHRTGGQHHASNGLELGMRAAARPAARYLLTWSSRGMPGGSPRDVEVEVKRPFVRLYYPRTRFQQDPSALLRRQLYTAALVGAARGNSRLDALVANTPDNRLTVDAAVHLGQRSRENAAPPPSELTVAIASYDAAGTMLEIGEQTIPVTPPAAGKPWLVRVQAPRVTNATRIAVAVLATSTGEVGIRLLDLPTATNFGPGPTGGQATAALGRPAADSAATVSAM